MRKRILIVISILTTWYVHGTEMKKVSEDSGKTINLARTSLALVSASSCNGDRPISNKFYGILNAFDGESNWINKINYSYWLGNRPQKEWVEVEFSCPVSVESLILEGSTQCNACLYFENGEEKVFQKIVSMPTKIYTMDGTVTPIIDLGRDNKGMLKFEEVMNGVTKVRLTFTGNGNPQLGELKVMGPIPDGKKYKVGKPRLKVTKKDSLLVANDAYRNWLERTWKSERS